MEDIARRHGAGDSRRAAMESYVRVANTALMTQSIRDRCDRIIGRMSRLPLIALALSALAVMATLAASVRARCRELGVLRCVGLSRFQLFRLILGEGLLTGVVACLLGAIFGLIAAWTGIYVSSLGWGVSSPYRLPWGTLALGGLVTLAAGFIGAFLPAAAAALRSPLELFYARKGA